MKIEISDGDLIDKFTILKLKLENISHQKQKENILKEYLYISEQIQGLMQNQKVYDLYVKLVDTNNQLWLIEDAIRIKEKNKSFDSDFIELARKVYITNDLRASIKKEINHLTESNFIEEKSYEQY